jgi:ribokinase
MAAPTDRPRSFDVVVVGSANLDLVTSVEHLPAPGETVTARGYAEHPGGKGLNQAVAARRSGSRTAFIGCLGRDAAGDALHRVMTDEGIDAFVVDVAAPTGRALIAVDQGAENSIVVVPGANHQVGIGVIDDHRSILSDTHVVLAQLEIPLDAVEAAFAIARLAGAITILNPAPAAAIPAGLLSLCDIVMPNQTELAQLGGADALLAAGVSTVVTTLGARGLRVITADGTIDVPPYAVRAVDTTGAGDAACGALAASLAHGSDVVTAARRAAAAGALAATRAGAVPSLPTAIEIDGLVDG